MTGSADHNELIDAKLVAWLDGVLPEGERLELAQALADNPQLAQRLATLDRGGRDFKAAFDPLLDAAPDAAMQDMLAGLIARTKPGEHDFSPSDNVVPLRPKRTIWSRMGSLAAAAGITLAIFSGGVYTGWQTGEKPVGQQTKIGWRQAAAQYVSLYSKQTLAGYPVDPTVKKESWQRVSNVLDLPLTGKKAQIDNLTLKGTQILQLKGKPLVQIAYLHKQETPVALCIIKSSKQSFQQKFEQRLGLNIVHWVHNGHGYMLIGKVPKDELQKIAAPLVAHFS